ncbi:MAG TPA: carbamoyltransferase HypF [Pirellulales bacterium]|nr:carbamoyltransferase HypF [Pirellulales bacterium]
MRNKALYELTAEVAGATKVTARRIVLTGRVQGVGLRPAVARWAAALGLAGCVKNTRRGAELEIEGAEETVDRFIEGLVQRLPEATHVDAMCVEVVPPASRRAFAIEPSAGGGRIAARVPVDLAVCAECLIDVASLSNRRNHYPFTSCTSCGPRYSITSTMPYDRAASSMARFEMCPACRREYQAPVDRRFHSQTNACPACGPGVWIAKSSGQSLAADQGAIVQAIETLVAGRIVALRGVGGYQLLVDAANEDAVTLLRQRKLRPCKPLAVLVDTIATAERLATLNDDDRRALTDPANPIVVVRARHENGLAKAIYSGMDCVGLLLPTTPLHWQLVQSCGRPLVATSGNREGEPLAHEVDEAHEQLASIADTWLHHDRPIARPIDDSVVRVIAGRQVTIRLARGLAPLSLELPCNRPILALGGQQKAAVALANGAQAVLGPHTGDLDALRTRDRFVAHVRQFVELYGAEPELLVHDLHPDYFTTCWAAKQPLPSFAVQHHHAHIVAGMLEHGWLDREVLGVAFDGTGYGADGTIWGGEFLVATASEFRRVASLRPFRLPGGESAIREPWRIALALVAQAASPQVAVEFADDHFRRSAAEGVLAILNLDRFSPVTTSAGRLFDGVASLILDTHVAKFEGEPAMRLEAACDPSAPGAYDLPLRDGKIVEIDWRPLVAAVQADRMMGVPPGAMAMKFHRAVAAAIAAVTWRFPDRPVVLGGGVFQNRVLIELLCERWSGRRQALGLPGRIPPNDGGLAAGQLAVAACRTNRG